MRAAVEAVAGKEWLGRARGLDVGAGNGAFELAMATAGYFIVGVEPLWNETVLACAKEADLPLRRVVARAEQLPFRNGAFDLVTCFDAVEHLREPSRVGTDVSRFSAEGALLFITTPPRLRYLFDRDPHYGIWGLLLLPSRTQQRLALRRGFPELYHTERIYFLCRSIVHIFSGFKLKTILSRWKPRTLHHVLWEFIVAQKTAR